MLMMRIVLATVCWRFASWGFDIKVTFCSDFEHKIWSRFWSWLLMFGWDFVVDSWSRFWRWNFIKFYLNKSLTLWPNLSFQICNKLLPTQSSSSTSATETTSTSFELASSHARVTSIKFTKREWVSEVSYWQGKTKIGLGTDKNKWKKICVQWTIVKSKSSCLKGTYWTIRR